MTESALLAVFQVGGAKMEQSSMEFTVLLEKELDISMIFLCVVSGLTSTHCTHSGLSRSSTMTGTVQ